VNAFQQADEKPLDILKIDLAVETEQCASLNRVKADRSQADLNRTLDAVRRAAEAEENVLPTLIDAARARATVGETMHALADVYGRCDTAVV
jgi:methylmalonyl-CoA mutase N-terminal domain/subunit